MTPERWRQVTELFHAALARDESQRAAFLRDACPDDEPLRHEVASMLDQRADAEGFLEVPAFAVAVGVVAEDRGQSLAGRTGAGRMSRPRVPWWIQLCAASFVGYFGLSMFSIFYPPVSMGVALGAAADGLGVLSVTAGSTADRAGVRQGDKVVSLNGRPLRTLLDQRVINTSASIGVERTFVFERSGRQFSVAYTPRRRVLGSGGLRFLPQHIALLAALVFSLVVIYSRPEDRVARLGALLLASIACTYFFPRGLAGTWRHLPVLAGALLWPACLSAIAVGPILFSLFALFPKPVIHRRWIWIAALLPGAVCTAWGGLYLMLIVYQPERSLDFLPGWSIVFAQSSILAYFAASIAMLVWNYRRLTDVNERRRVRVLLAGTAAAGVGGLFSAVFFLITNFGLALPTSSLFLVSGPVFAITGLLFVSMPLAFAYAIVAQRLFDIRIIIRQGLQYAFARRSILLLVPALAAGLVVDLVVHAEQPLTDIIQARGWAYVALAGLAAVVYRNRDGWTTSLDRRFFRERYDAHQILRQVIDDVRAAARLDTLAPVVVSRISAAFHSTFVALLVCEPHQRDFHVMAVAPDTSVVPRLMRDSTLVGLVRVLGKPIDVSTSPDWLDDELPAQDAAAIRAARVDLVAPIVTGAAHQREALLVLGTKRSEEPYGRDDRQLVASVAASLAVLLERRPDEGETDEAFAECPQCGACDGINASRCAEDGTPLVRVSIPRVLGGRYTIRRRLGSGGMGTVYEAHDGALERRVAVKVIRDDIIGSPHAADRFRREALVAASFAHPNVVTVHDFGVTDRARAYLVMERLNGATLGETLRRDGRLASSRTLHVMRGVCQAVDAAHRRQLVHRDLKPDNIFLTKEDVPKVLDFGIAKFVRPALDSTALTATGAVIGTLGYMSPEQVRGGAPDPSWDLWALAVVAYEMLAGRRPFADASSLELFPSRFPLAPTRLTDRHPELPSALDSVFARAFSLDPAERPTGALVFMGSLKQALDG